MRHYIKAYCFIIGFILFYQLSVFAQDQNKADSLKVVFESGNKYGEERLELLHDLAYNSTKDLNEALSYADILIEEAKESSNNLFLFFGYEHKGQTYRMAGDMPEALNAFFKASEVALKLKDIKYLGGVYIAIADVYSEFENADNAELYYNKGIALLRESDDKVTLATALLNAGDEYFNNKKYDKALRNFKESSTIFTEQDSKIGSAYNLGNIGMVYAEQGKNKLAKKNIDQAITILEEFEDYYAISEYLTYMSDIYREQGKTATAVIYAERSLDLAKKYELKKQLSESNLKLSILNEELNPSASLKYFKDYITHRDSFINIEKQEKIFNQEVSLNQLEIKNAETEAAKQKLKVKNQRLILWSTLGVLFLIGILAYNLFKKNKFVKKTNKIIAAEKDRSDKLLLNILPEETAQELKDKGRVEAKQFPSVTVLFTDFVGFTRYAEKLSPEDLVKTIDHYFSKFDLIMEKYGLEKIKTIGDAYMAVGGLSLDNTDQAKEMVLAAQEMNDFVTEAKLDNTTTAEFDIRIGINTGSVVAGVVGTKKFAYDIWGDTVNIASRMESNSEAGRINISEDTYKVIKNEFECEYRGELAVKNRGELKMYFIS